MSIRNPEFSEIIELARYFGDPDSGQYDPRAARVYSELSPEVKGRSTEPEAPDEAVLRSLVFSGMSVEDIINKLTTG